MESYEGILRGEGLELVLSSAEVVSRLLLQVLRDLLGEALIGVKTSADGSTSLSDLVYIL